VGRLYGHDIMGVWCYGNNERLRSLLEYHHEEMPERQMDSTTRISVARR